MWFTMGKGLGLWIVTKWRPGWKIPGLFIWECWLEWISTHQCTSWGWARSAHFADEHPPCLMCFFSPDVFFFPTSSLPHLPPPSYLKPTSPSYLPPTNPTPPHSIARARLVERKLELWSCCCGAMESELWSWSRSSSAHQTHTPTIR
jgi:hypothetical protein